MYYGKYRAKVLKVDKSTKKIKVKCEDIYGGYESPWCTPCIPFIEITAKSKTKEAGEPTHTHNIEINVTLWEIIPSPSTISLPCFTYHATPHSPPPFGV